MSNGTLHTVEGTVSVDDPGIILAYEHLFTDLHGSEAPGYTWAPSEDALVMLAPYAPRTPPASNAAVEEPD